MLGNYSQNLQLDSLMFQNFTSLLFPPQQYSPSSSLPMHHTIFPVGNNINNSPMGDFSMMKFGSSNMVESPPVLTREISPTSQPFPASSVSIPDMVANTSGFHFLPQFFDQSPTTSFGQMLNWQGFQQMWATTNLAQQTFMPSHQLPPRWRPADMPVLSPLLPGISSTSLQSFATLPLVPISSSPKNIESTNLLLEFPPKLYPNSTPSFFEQRIPQDPTTSSTTTTTSSFDEMPSFSTSSSFEIPSFHSIFDITDHNKNEETYSISSTPNSPPILTLIDDPIHSDDPNPPTLKPEVDVEEEFPNEIDKNENTDFNLLSNEPPKLDQEEITPLTEESNITLENSSLNFPNSSTSSEDSSFLNNTETSNAISEEVITESRFVLEEEPILDSVEAIRQFNEELNLSEADWIEIMTESRRKRLRPSTQANTVAALSKSLNNHQNHKNGKNVRKTRSSGSSERENHVKFHENESENQAPSSTTELYSSPISIDVDFCKETCENSTPSSSGISSSSNMSEHSAKNQSKWKVLRRSKNGNTLWLGAKPNQDDNNNNHEEQKENVFVPREVPSPIQRGIKRRHSIGCRKVRKPKRIKSNWQPIGNPVEKLVRLCNDAIPSLQECYTAIKHRYETDEIIRVRDCVKVRSAEGLENVGKVMNFYIDENSGYLMASVLWYYTREQIDIIKNPLLIPLHGKELLASRHIDHVACDAIESIAFVLTFNEYCRYITEGQIDSLPACLRPLESQEIWPRGEENYPRRSRLPHEDSPFEVVYFSRRVYDVKMKRVYVPKLSSSSFLRPTRSLLTRPIRASSH